MNNRLGSAEWADDDLVSQAYAYKPGSFWIGRSLTGLQVPLGYQDDLHIYLVSGSRAGTSLYASSRPTQSNTLRGVRTSPASLCPAAADRNSP